jgi:hypothetical protein
MLFTWDTNNLCIVFKQWHITSTASLVISLIAIVAIVAGYEALRDGIRRFESWTNKRVENMPSEWPCSPCFSRWKCAHTLVPDAESTAKICFEVNLNLVLRRFAYAGQGKTKSR